jgi:hypothetical protein
MPETPDAAFLSRLVYAANQKIGRFYMNEGGKGADVGKDIVDDKPADVIDRHGHEWRIKVMPQQNGLVVTRHRIIRAA